MQKGLKKYFVNMDEYLCSLGLYRKMVARDASSLFRAVSEQVITSLCCVFCPLQFVEGSFEKYLERLEDPKETVGQVEIKALSQLYRRCFLIYRYPGKPATIISEDDFVDKVTLCCSINGHYDIVYPRSYPASAALCQSLLYELLYTQVFGFEEAELCQAMEAFRVGGRRYRNSPSMCSDVDLGYDTPEDRGEEAESGGPIEEKPRAVTDDSKPPAEAPPPSRLSLPYKVMKSLDGDVYRNLEFDVWQDTCKEMQKTDYMVFAGRQYFLGDKCQVRLEPKGKYYNAFIQEVGTHSSAVTVFIEELGEKHLVPLTDLKPVNPVPAWNVAAPSRKGDLGASFFFFPIPSLFCFILFLSTRFLNRHLIGTQLTYYHPGRRYYQDYESFTFRRSRRQLAAALNKECQFGFPEAVEEPADLDAAISYYQLDGAGDGVFPPLPVSMCWEKSSDDGGACVHGALRRLMIGHRLVVEEEDSGVTFSGHILLFPMQGPTVAPPPSIGPPAPPSGSSYRVQRGSGPLSPAPPPRNTPVCSSEEEQEDISTVEDQGEDATAHFRFSLPSP
uniref:ubiquitinyl hydrolase 1 n=1 Tax=Maylandia zebra TaxID=106582 RepID=A0A3P9AS60_9CICH